MKVEISVLSQGISLKARNRQKSVQQLWSSHSTPMNYYFHWWPGRDSLLITSQWTSLDISQNNGHHFLWGHDWLKALLIFHQTAFLAGLMYLFPQAKMKHSCLSTKFKYLGFKKIRYAHKICEVSRSSEVVRAFLCVQEIKESKSSV